MIAFLWPGLRDGCARPLERPWPHAHNAQPRKVRHSPLSSWVLCADLYLPFEASPEARVALADFLRVQTGLSIAEVIKVELEYALPNPLNSGTSLGEQNGERVSRALAEVRAAEGYDRYQAARRVLDAAEPASDFDRIVERARQIEDKDGER